MARKRMIDPRIWDSEQVQGLSDRQFKLYMYLISNADDEGRFKISHRMLAARAFPLDASYTTTEADIEVITSSGLIKVYTVSGALYGYHPNWAMYQSIQKKVDSILPSPEEADITEEIALREDYSSATVGVAPNRIEKNRIEENITYADAGAEAPGELVLYDEIPGDRQTITGSTIVPASNLKDPIAAKIEDLFVSTRGEHVNYGKERKACITIARTCRSRYSDHPEDFAVAMTGEYLDMINSGDKFWREQPRAPSGLMAHFDRVESRLRERDRRSATIDERLAAVEVL